MESAEQVDVGGATGELEGRQQDIVLLVKEETLVDA